MKLCERKCTQNPTLQKAYDTAKQPWVLYSGTIWYSRLHESLTNFEVEDEIVRSIYVLAFAVMMKRFSNLRLPQAHTHLR